MPSSGAQTFRSALRSASATSLAFPSAAALSDCASLAAASAKASAVFSRATSLPKSPSCQSKQEQVSPAGIQSFEDPSLAECQVHVQDLLINDMC
jgi:hypothetical protein